MYAAFLSGPVDEVPDYRVRFALAVVRFHGMRPGAAVFNPAELADDRDVRWQVRQRLDALFDSEMLISLPDWVDCPLCRAERALAEFLGLPVMDIDLCNTKGEARYPVGGSDWLGVFYRG